MRLFYLVLWNNVFFPVLWQFQSNIRSFITPTLHMKIHSFSNSFSSPPPPPLYTPALRATTFTNHWWLREFFREQGSRGGAVVRALAFHQCVSCLIPGPSVICGLSLLVLYSASRGFSPGTPVFPSPKKTTFNLIWIVWFIHLIWFIWFTVSPISTRVLQWLET